ncbi:MAG: hypothetical protein HXS52_00605 [Theionarchaea archaeon]|nr:hypothetical protein [Theionarchaea archaeon]MBU7036402.1 hypothetical protein [Theionarchaea archaeon]
MEHLEHPPGPEKEWNESYYFNFYDPRTCIGGFTRIGFKPNKNEAVGYLFLFYQNEILKVVLQDKVETVPERIQVGSLQFVPEWTLAFSGKMAGGEATIRNVDVRLKYAPLHTEFSYLACVTSQQQEICKVVCADHYEQMGLVTGRITVDSCSQDIRALGERDHSWGERDWNAPDLWIYVTAPFDPEFGINIAQMRINGEEINTGFIMENGENFPVLDVKAECITQDGRQKEVLYRISDVRGRRFTLKGRVLNTVQIPYRGRGVSVLNENLTSFECGKKKGYGIAEYLVRIE